MIHELKVPGTRDEGEYQLLFQKMGQKWSLSNHFDKNTLSKLFLWVEGRRIKLSMLRYAALDPFGGESRGSRARKKKLAAAAPSERLFRRRSFDTRFQEQMQIVGTKRGGGEDPFEFVHQFPHSCIFDRLPPSIEGSISKVWATKL